MAQTIAVTVGAAQYLVSVDFEKRRWASEPGETQLGEGDFPIAFEHDGKRYELYDDHTFNEVELP
jgi:hypothetical protein